MTNLDDLRGARHLAAVYGETMTNPDDLSAVCRAVAEDDLNRGRP